jgi:hypothetical protein
VVVLSPHLDDAVFSVGASILRAARGGARVSVLTVFAGDPCSTAPAGSWDRQAGFATEGEATTARRREDDRACALVSATPIWLSFRDEQYSSGSDDEAIAGAIADALAPADTLLMPGFPLSHRDHLRVVRLVLERELFGGSIVLYVEQPYALWVVGPVGVPGALAALLPGMVRWCPSRVGYVDLARKVLACRAYATQLACIRRPIVWSMAHFERTSDAVLGPVETRCFH